MCEFFTVSCICVMIFFVQNFYAVINCYFKQTQLDSVCKSYTDDEDVGHTGRFPRIP